MAQSRASRRHRRNKFKWSFLSFHARVGQPIRSQNSKINEWSKNRYATGRGRTAPRSPVEVASSLASRIGNQSAAPTFKCSRAKHVRNPRHIVERYGHLRNLVHCNPHARFFIVETDQRTQFNDISVEIGAILAFLHIPITRRFGTVHIHPRFGAVPNFA